MSKAKLVLVLAFLLVFGAGAVVGMVQQQHHFGHEGPRGPGHLSDQLGLSPEQQQQMKQIWSAVDASRHDTWEKRRELQKQRDQELQALLSPEQKSKFEAIKQQYQKSMDDLSVQHEKLIESAVEKTKGILSESQRVKYEEIRKSWSDRGSGRRGGSHGGPMHSGPDTHPTTLPTPS